MTKPDPPSGLPWKYLGVGQFVLFLLSLLAFMDMQSRIETVKYECGCQIVNAFESYDGLENELRDAQREKRSLKGWFN